MPKPAVIVVGHCTVDSARIFCCAEAQGKDHSFARLAWRAGGEEDEINITLRAADPYHLGVFELDLPPSATVEYAIDVSATESDLPQAATLLSGPLNSFRLLPRGRPLRVGLVSCNGVYQVADESRRYSLWRHLKTQIDQQAIDLLIHAGDQIYADPIWMRYDSDHRNRDLSPAAEERMTALTAEYRRWYVERSWNAPPVAEVLASCPNLMMWDDHDIYDGYGSHDDDSEPPQQAFLLAAKQAFEEFQTSHGPGRLDPESSYLAAFTHEEVGIVFLDARTNRMWRRNTVVGEKQLSAFDEWTRAHLRNLKRLYIVSSIPLVHANVSAALRLFRIIPGREGIEDDLRDTWTASRNRDECQRFVKRLFALLEKNPALQITILSGDVHVGAVGEIRSRLMRSSKANESWPRIHQVTSSGIGHPPPEGIGLWFMKRTSRDWFQIGSDDFEGRLITLHGVSDLVLARRNFAVLNLGDEAWEPHGNLRVDFHAEVEAEFEVFTQILNGPGRAA
jgi:phosphodiesterase/alkaline phosphatase D-like protein